MDSNIEHELCANCKKDIPQQNYVMHTMHCARNITLCKICNEPIPKSQFKDHQESCKPKPKKSNAPPTSLERSSYFQERKVVEEQKAANRRENYLKKNEKLVDTGFTLKESVSNGTASNDSVKKDPPNSGGALKKDITGKTIAPQTAAKSKAPSGMLACKYCDLELPKLELEEHENYCGSRTDKCLECGELVMFKHKQLHLDSNHGFLKLNDEPGPRASWDSTTQRSSTTSSSTSRNITSSYESPTRRRFERFRPFVDFDFDATPYLPSSYAPSGAGGIKKKEGESYKEISRRLDCKTEYIRNLLHDSASITVPLRHNGAMPRNHFNHNKGPAPQPPPQRRRNPPTELVIPCEFCSVPVPHEDLIEHERGCRPDLARFNPRRRSPEMDDYFTAPPPSSPEVELPCEFCADMIPASQLLRHQSTCLPA